MLKFFKSRLPILVSDCGKFKIEAIRHKSGIICCYHVVFNRKMRGFPTFEEALEGAQDWIRERDRKLAVKKRIETEGF